MALGLTEPLTEMSTRNIPGVKGQPARKAENLPAIWTDCLENVGASMSHSAMGLHGLLQGYIIVYFLIHVQHAWKRYESKSLSYRNF
jgi:hypothetical protein